MALLFFFSGFYLASIIINRVKSASRTSLDCTCHFVARIFVFAVLLRILLLLLYEVFDTTFLLSIASHTLSLSLFLSNSHSHGKMYLPGREPGQAHTRAHTRTRTHARASVPTRPSTQTSLDGQRLATAQNGPTREVLTAALPCLPVCIPETPS